MAKKRRKKKAFYLVTMPLTPYDMETIDEFHVTMFHGMAYREGRVFPGYKFLRLPGYVNRWPPLELVKNVYGMGDIINPGAELVVSCKIKELLKGVPKIKFKGVEFKVLFEKPYTLCEFDHWQKYKTDNVFSFLNKQKHHKKLESTIGDYYELCLHSYRNISGKFMNGFRVRKDVNSATDEPLVMNVSDELFESYPIINHPDGVIFHEDIFNIIEPYFN